MLVLTRRKGQSFHVSGEAVVTLLESRANGNQKIGIEAPTTTKITRSELIEAAKEMDILPTKEST